MLKLFKTLTTIILVSQAYGDECPSPNNIPVMNDEGTEFVCGVRWFGHGAEHAIDGCNDCDGYGPFTMMANNDCDNEGDGWCPSGSILVKAGCTLYGWEGLHYTGEVREWHGPNVFPDGCVETGKSSTCPKWCYHDSVCGCYSQGPRSAKCRCQQQPIICDPQDFYEEVYQCNNCKGETDLKCTYEKKVGTKYTAEVQESMSIDTSIESAMSAAFFDFFSESIGVSVSTGYDWTHASSEIKDEIHTYTAETGVKPGTIWTLEGAIGQCGDNIVRTERFRAITSDCDGNILNEVYETELVNEIQAVGIEQQIRN